MSVRALLLPAVFLTMFAVSGAPVPQPPEPPLRPENRPGPAAQPLPGQPKTIAQLLVGKWKLVRHTEDGFSYNLRPDTEDTTEYTADGRYRWLRVSPKAPHPLLREMGRRGTYRLEGSMIRCASQGGPHAPFEIRSVTEDRLVTAGHAPRLTLENVRDMYPNPQSMRAPPEQIIREAGEVHWVCEYVRVRGQ